MAVQQVASYSDKPIDEKQKEKEFKEHTQTYAAFISGTKWTVISTAILLVILYLIFVY
ncbi:aa3-type cytochrome c oxidase subunit IV [Pelagibacterium sp.]|uniref:aa3-type cytochrome c oxidase subunit IV n=1 Tax=Pelagibacterium sp. TaxID=1967288 RepID=UPI003A92E6D9